MIIKRLTTKNTSLELQPTPTNKGSKMFTQKEIKNSDKLQPKAKQWALDNFDYLCKPITTLFSQSVKTNKGPDKYEIPVMYLQPHNKVGKETLCIGAEMGGCAKDCLISSGHLGMNAAQKASTKRTILYLLKPQLFEQLLLLEIDQKHLAGQMAGKIVYFRLNGTSDIDWSHIIKQRPNCNFYDYTKNLAMASRNKLPNYDVTFSGSMFSKQSKAALKKAVTRKLKIALAFNTKHAKKDTLIIASDRFADFDKDDLRPLNTSGTIGSLTRKGSNSKKRQELNKVAKSFFVTEANIDELNQIIARA